MSKPQFSDDELEFVEPSTDAEWDEYYRLRYERLRKPLGLPPESVRNDPLDPGSLHRVIKVGERIVAAVTWAVGVRQEDGRRVIYVRFRQLAVEPEFEGRGIGGAAIRYRERYARSIGAEEIVANARVENVPWFEHHGFEVVGDGVKLFDQVESMAMVKRLR